MGRPAHTACLPDARELQKMQIQFLRLGEWEVRGVGRGEVGGERGLRRKWRGGDWRRQGGNSGVSLLMAAV